LQAFSSLHTHWPALVVLKSSFFFKIIKRNEINERKKIYINRLILDLTVCINHLSDKFVKPLLMILICNIVTPIFILDIEKIFSKTTGLDTGLIETTSEKTRGISESICDITFRCVIGMPQDHLHSSLSFLSPSLSLFFSLSFSYSLTHSLTHGFSGNYCLV